MNIYSTKKFTKKVNKKDFYKEYIDILNGKLHFSPRETQILEILMRIDVDWNPKFEGQFKNIIDRDVRKYIMAETFVNKNNLSMYIKNMKEKRLLIPTVGKGWQINPVFLPKVDDNNKINVAFELHVIEG